VLAAGRNPRRGLGRPAFADYYKIRMRDRLGERPGLKGRSRMGALLRAINRTRGTVVCERLECADSLAAQSRGLIGRESLDADDGMLFINGRLMPFIWMHMFFMKFAIDIVFLGRDDR
jgi:Uncharacterized ACR, COG1430